MAKKPAAKKPAAKKLTAKKTPAKSKPAAKAKKAAPKVAAKPSKPAPKSAKPATKKPAKSAISKIAKTIEKAVAKVADKATVAMKPMKSSGGLPRFTPLDDRIVVQRVAAPEKTAGGLYIPDSAQEKPTVGKVVAVGRGHRDAKGRTRPCDVKVGDRVLFTAWTGSEIELDGGTFVILRETDLLGVTSV